MKENQSNTTRNWISFRVKPAEYTIIYQYFEASTCQKLSEYARLVLLNKPIVVNYRNQSADEILSAMYALKKELTIIGSNFNQAVHKLHSIKNVPEVEMWAMMNEAAKQNLLHKIEEIRIRMTQLYEQWSRK